MKYRPQIQSYIHQQEVNMKEIVQLKNLHKEYRTTKALNNISLTVNVGDIYGLIGPNGAGKSTLIKILTGLSKQTDGDVVLFEGEELSKARRKIGSVIETPAFFKNMTATENLLYYALQFNCPRERVMECIDLVNLTNVKDKKKFKDYSLGMKQRLGLAFALMNNPKLIILDEPTNGLDPVGISDLRDTIRKLNEKGVTFIISSHILSELSQIATRFGIINNGTMITEFSKEELTAMSSDKIIAETTDVQRLADALSKNAINHTMSEGNIVEIEKETTSVNEVASIMVENGIEILSIYKKEITLEEVFLKILNEGGKKHD